MVIDAAKGIESQTRKLFEVCRHRRIPIFTFINKLDRPTREPLELLDELEKVLGLHPFPVNWPMGTGIDFRGVYDRLARQVHLFERTPGGAFKAPESVSELSDPMIQEHLDSIAYHRFKEEIEMLDAVGTPFDPPAILSGETTPVYFGSAMNNFGVELLLSGFLKQSAPPAPRRAATGWVAPEDPSFSGFIFKIQSNMDPRHRDRVAYLRVCSGVFKRDMTAFHSGTGRAVRLSNSHKIFGRDRETINEAFAGDIVGLVGHPEFKIGDTLSETPGIAYHEIPRFPPECFAFLFNPNTSKYKSFRKGVEQLTLEGIVQPFTLRDAPGQGPLLAAVGPLQFEVLQYRLKSEYGVDSRLERAAWESVRWMDAETGQRFVKDPLLLPLGSRLGQDAAGQDVIFFPNAWAIGYLQQNHPEIRLQELPDRDQTILDAAAQSIIPS